MITDKARASGLIVWLDKDYVEDTKRWEAFMFVRRQRGKSTVKDVVTLRGLGRDDLDERVQRFVEEHGLVETASGDYERCAP